MKDELKTLVEEADARAEKATAGPWACRPSVDRHGDDCEDVIAKGAGNVTIASEIERDSSDNSHDAEFIAHARQDIPALCAAVREQDAEIARLKERLREYEPTPSERDDAMDRAAFAVGA